MGYFSINLLSFLFLKAPLFTTDSKSFITEISQDSPWFFSKLLNEKYFSSFSPPQIFGIKFFLNDIG